MSPTVKPRRRPVVAVTMEINTRDRLDALAMRRGPDWNRSTLAEEYIIKGIEHEERRSRN